MPTAADVFSIVPSMLDDDEQQYVTDDAMRPRLQLVLDDLIETVLTNPNIDKFKSYVVVPAVPAGTTSLAAEGYFAPGGPLEMLEEVQFLWEKQVGAQPQYYSRMNRANIIWPCIPSLFNGVYQATSDVNGTQDIRLPGATQALDMMFFASWNVQKITDGASPIPPQTKTVLRFGTAAAFAFAHGNPTLAQGYEAKHQAAKDSLVSQIIMAQQLIRIRQGAFVTNTDQNWQDGFFLP